MCIFVHIVMQTIKKHTWISGLNHFKPFRWLLFFLNRAIFSTLCLLLCIERCRCTSTLEGKLVGSVAPNPCWPILFHFPLLHFIWGYFHTWEFNWRFSPLEFDVFGEVWKMCCKLEKQSQVHLKIVVRGWLGADSGDVSWGPQQMWKPKHIWSRKMCHTILLVCHYIQ